MLSENVPVEQESKYHRYVGNVIPWGVRLIWIGFWVFAIYYTLKYALPALQRELVSPP
jgi:hypothetical protein